MPPADSAPPQELLDRHTAFWRRQADAPLLAQGRPWPFWADVRRMYGPEDGVEVLPKQADAERYMRAFAWGACWRPGETDLLLPLPPCPRIPWMEAIAGCRVVAAPSSNSVWSREPEGLAPEPDRVAPNEGWIEALLGQIDYLNDHAPAGIPVTQTLMRGPGDVIEALIGATPLLYGMTDGALWLRRLIESVTDLFIRVARLQWDRIRPTWGGYVNFFGFWSPGPCVRVQEDVQRLLSPALYREWLRPALERIVGEFPHSMFHIHSGSLHLVEEVATVPDLGALQVSIDEPPYAPPVLELTDALRRVQEHVPLFVEGPMSAAEFEGLQERLSPRGLALRREAGG
jgi:hypothetical protein